MKSGNHLLSVISVICLIFVCFLSRCHAFAPILPNTLRGAAIYKKSSFITSPPERTSPTTGSSTALYGIPKMFRWLTDQYPNINRRLHEGLGNVSVDNFYLDMNGIIHPCTHGNAEGEIIVLDETAMFKKIFLYVDRYVLYVESAVTRSVVIQVTLLYAHSLHVFFV